MAALAPNPAAGASPPVFEQIFRNARFAQGGNAHFEGKVRGNPTPQIIWTRKGMQMKGKKTAKATNKHILSKAQTKLIMNTGALNNESSSSQI
jgi:hypothetical protein